MNSKIKNIYLGQAIGDALGLATESFEQGLKAIIVKVGDGDTNGFIAGSLMGGGLKKFLRFGLMGLKGKILILVNV